MRPTISLLHATYRRHPGPVEVKQAWLERADDAASVEYIFAMDDDDEATLLDTQGHQRVVGPGCGGVVTSVRNWNAAAAMATGDLLMVVADDLFPPQGWDSALRSLIGAIDPLRVPLAVKLTDSGDRGDLLLRHPVVTRAFYDRWGLFSDAYRGVYCDNDITTRAYWRAVILDGRMLALDHRHPSVLSGVESSESFVSVNREAEYEYGAVVYTSIWSARCREARIRLVPAPRHPRVARLELMTRRGCNIAAGNYAYWRRRATGFISRRSPLPRWSGRGA